MSFKFERKVNYYETDRMGIVHHSNYIRYLEEARCAWLESVDMPFWLLEQNDITIPVLGVNCEYKHHVTFGDTIIIKPFEKDNDYLVYSDGRIWSNKSNRFLKSSISG